MRGGQGGCDRRNEFFGKIQKKKKWVRGGGVGLVRGGGSGWMCERRIEVFVKIQKKKLGGGDPGGGGGRVGGGDPGGGVRVDVNEELKFL